MAQLAQIESPRSILALCTEVDLLEAQADHVMRAAMARLFREENDASQLVKLKAIYELLESLTARCKDVANAVATNSSPAPRCLCSGTATFRGIRSRRGGCGC